MGVDVVPGPATGFREWSDEQWEDYFETAEKAEGDKLGSYTSVSCTIETIRLNLEDGRLGTKYPLFMRIAELEGGWYHAELPGLIAEIEALRRELADLPLERVVFSVPEPPSGASAHPTAPELEDLRRGFNSAFPDRPLRNLADFNHHLLNTLATMASSAVDTGNGLLLC